VTVVFSDLSGSTALGERLDPESLSRVMTRYYEAMRAVVLHHGGTVEKFAGDAVMAVFGVPVAHEDDALRAVRAAAGMHAALAELNEARSCSAAAPGAWSATPSRSSRPGMAGRARRHDTPFVGRPQSCACSSGRTSGRPARAPCTS
jgi:hypothetical protein